MSNDHLESYMLMFVEKSLLDSLEYDTIIQRYASSSSELSKLLKEYLLLHLAHDLVLF